MLQLRAKSRSLGCQSREERGQALFSAFVAVVYHRSPGLAIIAHLFVFAMSSTSPATACYPAPMEVIVVCDCSVCKRVPILEGGVAATGEAIGTAWKHVQADPDDAARRAELREASTRYVSAMDAIKQFAATNHATLSEHGSRVRYLA